ncbi:MAG TPA: hypothetical protein VK730_03645 [Solirubrobacteraceae bacterium]|jgi:hypothetical protein|nr:hypothetical protein [Solirubrobacteraceae bacterium]
MFVPGSNLPRLLLVPVGCAVDRVQLHGRCMAGEPVEHPSRTDGGELLAVAHSDELCSRALDQIGERVEAFVVNHSRLIEDDRCVGPNIDTPGVCSGGERVERHRVPVECRTVGTEPLGDVHLLDGDLGERLAIPQTVHNDAK